MGCVVKFAILFMFCPALFSDHVLGHNETVAESPTVSSFEQKLNSRVQRFDTAGKTLVASVVELAFTYELPTAIEYVSREAGTQPLNLDFHNESVRRILETLAARIPGYGVDFSHGVVDLFAAKGREDQSNLLNKTIKDFAVAQLDTHEADFQLFCALGREVGSQVCGGSLVPGQWGPLKIKLHLQNAKTYEVLNAIVAQNGKAIWTLTVRPDKLSKIQFGGLWYVYPLQQPFKTVVSERLAIIAR